MEDDKRTNEDKNSNESLNNTSVDKKPKSNNKIKITIFILLIVLCLVVTAFLILLSIDNINKKYNNNNNNENYEDTVKDNEQDYVEEIKTTEDSDKKYVCADNDTYDYNDINIEEVYVIDGVEYSSEEQNRVLAKKSSVEYIKISGLKDTNVQNKINNEILSKVNEFSNIKTNGKVFVYTRVEGNFSNILSLYIYYYTMETNDGSDISQKYYPLNYDLNTGEKIDLQDVFIKSTPIKMLISEGAYKALAWNVEGEFASAEFDKNSNMDNRDTSTYEDVLLKVSNIYNEKDGKLDFVVSPTEVSIYNMDIGAKRVSIDIDLYKYREYVAIYKRFLNSNSIYAKNDIAIKKVLAFTNPVADSTLNEENYIFTHQNNLYVDISKSYLSHNQDIDKDLLKKIVDSKKDEVLNTFSNISSKDSKMGYIYQGYLEVNKVTTSNSTTNTNGVKVPYIELTLNYSLAKAPINDYNKKLFEYINYGVKLPTASLTDNLIGTFININKDFPEIVLDSNEQYIKRIIYYFDVQGNFLTKEEK